MSVVQGKGDCFAAKPVGQKIGVAVDWENLSVFAYRQRVEGVQSQGKRSSQSVMRTLLSKSHARSDLKNGYE